MPIAVLCPSCKARFSVSEKFAGKKGPCPKCKAVITVPDAMVAEVKVHAPEAYASGGKDTKGRPVGKPIPRQETKLEKTTLVAIIAAILVILLVAIVMRGASESVKWPVVWVGLIALSPPLAATAYAFLRDDELEPYSGRALWIRTALCALVYIVLWGVYAVVRSAFGLTGETWEWLFLAAAFIPAGAAAAWAAFDLDFGTSSMHYSFYLLIMLVLCAIVKIPPVYVGRPAEAPGGAVTSYP